MSGRPFFGLLQIFGGRLRINLAQSMPQSKVRSQMWKVKSEVSAAHVYKPCYSEEVHLMRVMIPTNLLCTDVGIYHCLVALLIVSDPSTIHSGMVSKWEEVSLLVCLFKNPIALNKQTIMFEPWIILKVLTWCIVITTLIKSITLTHSLIDILIIIMSINVPSECIFTPTLRTYISTTSTSILL